MYMYGLKVLLQGIHLLHHRTELDASLQTPATETFVRSEHSVGLAVIGVLHPIRVRVRVRVRARAGLGLSGMCPASPV